MMSGNERYLKSSCLVDTSQATSGAINYFISFMAKYKIQMQSFISVFCLVLLHQAHIAHSSISLLTKTII